MGLDQRDRMSDLNEESLPMLQKIFDTIHNEAVGTVFTSTLPTATTTPTGKMVIYDDGGGTKRIYFKTGKDNLGYISLT